ncbi:MAG: hypothetical protein GDA67_09190 [Nitrospira sp. CR1.3]|nr:hypothetical protein [Nitrospira sp. CR1.3]
MNGSLRESQRSTIAAERNVLPRKLILLGSIVLSLCFAPYGFADEGHSQGAATHMKVSGVVSKVTASHTIIKTPWGQMTIASAAMPKGLEPGEEVEMWVNENNAVIDVHRKGDPSHSHKFVSGNLVYASADKAEIKLQTPDGEKNFDVHTGKSKLSAIQEGTPVTVEVNEAGKVIDVHRFNVEMTFNKQPRTKPGYSIKTHGVVEKIQSGIIVVKGPSATYRLNAKSAPSGIKVGDEISLWVNEEGMVIDHHMKGQAHAHRLISGKLIYVGKTKKEIKLWTPEGEKVFPLERLEVKAKPIKEGSTITVELNEQGTVVNLWKS